MSSRVPLIILALFAATLKAEPWETNAAFAPVLEDSTYYVASFALLPTAGGKVIVSQTYPTIIINGGKPTANLLRLNTDGSVDESFRSGTTGVSTARAACPDGRVIVQESTGSDSGTSTVRLVRLTTTGAIDPTFTPVVFGPWPEASVELLSDGRLLVSGLFSEIAGTTQPRICVLKSDGTIDPTFHSPFPPHTSVLEGSSFRAVALPDGRFVIVGTFAELGSARMRHVARLLSDGSVDETFNTSALTLPSGAKARMVYPVAGGVLVTYGGDWMSIGAPLGVLRLTNVGTIDPLFNPVTAGGDALFGPQQSDGKLLYLTHSSGWRELRRMNPDGSADPSFLVSSRGALNGPALALDGTLYVNSPVTDERYNSRFSATHLLANGTIDSSFSPVMRQQAAVTAFARQADGKLLVAGKADYVNGVKVGGPPTLVRLSADGSLDSTFAPVLASDEAFSVLQALSGETGVLAAQEPVAVGGSPRFVRFAADGTRDSNFQLPRAARTDVSVDSTGRIYGLTAGPTYGLRLERFTSASAMDPDYTPVALGAPALYALWPDGSAVATTITVAISPEMARGAVGRFNSDGSSASGFDIDRQDLPANVCGLVPLPDGGVLVIGTSEPATTALSFRRYNSTGALVYRYEGSANAIYGDPYHVREVGGVLYDTLLALNASSGTRLRADFTANFRPVSVEVDTDGKLIGLDTAAGGRTLISLKRTATTGPSVDASPKVLAVTRSDPGVLLLGGSVRLSASGTGLYPLTFQWYKDGVAIAGATSDAFVIASASAMDAGNYTVAIGNAYGSISSDPVAVAVNTTPAAPVLLGQLPARAVLTYRPALIEVQSFTATASGNPLPRLQWQRHGRAVPSSPICTVSGLLPEALDLSGVLVLESVAAHTGIHTFVATNDAGRAASAPLLVGLATTTKILGFAAEVGPDMLHPSGRRIDQLLLNGTAATFTADPGQVSRMSFVDLDHDIVQVEFSGAGTVSVSLIVSDPHGPLPPTNYTQPGVRYLQGHAAIVVTDADETSHLSVFSVGRANAYNQSLFREGVTYDGIADLAYVAILSRNGKFGSLRCGNVNFFDNAGYTGLYAPGVQFTGPVYLGNIESFGAQPVLLLGGTDADTFICGGDLEQPSVLPVQVSGLTRLRFVDGTTSHGALLPAQRNKARLEQAGVDVTDQIVVNP